MLNQIKLAEASNEIFQTTMANLNMAWSKLCLEHLNISKEYLIEHQSKKGEGKFSNTCMIYKNTRFGGCSSKYDIR